MTSSTPTSSAPANPKTLLFFLSHQDRYRKPLFSRREVFCSPDTDDRIAGDRVFGLRMPAGAFDVQEAVRRLPAEQQPELVVVKADATRRNFPRNLGSLACPKVLIVGVTHFLTDPIQELIRYAKSEPFDRIILEVTRHHAHWFTEAGLKNVSWLPAVTFGFLDRPLNPAPSRPLTFVGQTGRHHPYRRQVLDEVRKAGLPLEVLQGSLQETGDIYADSQITLNVSLNGDVNMRVFEALSAGGFLLTDELPEATGLRLLFEAGRHLDTWQTSGELIEKVRHYRDHPDEARRIRAAGQAELIRAHHPDVKLREFYDLVFDGRVNPRYDLALEPRTIVGPAAGTAARCWLDDLPVYESLQELHRHHARVTVFCDDDGAGWLADLPRLHLAPPETLATADPEAVGEPVLWIKGSATGLPALLAAFGGRHVFAPVDAAEILATWGFEPAKPESHFVRRHAARFLQRALEAGAGSLVQRLLPEFIAGAQTAADCLVFAGFAGALQAGGLRRRALERAVALDRHCTSALIQLAAQALDAGDRTSVLLLLQEAARVEPLPPAVDSLRAELAAALDAQPSVHNYAVLTHRVPTPPAARPRRILVVTNLFPPQELGGYGRQMWEFAHGLIARGHAVKIVAGHAGYLKKRPTADETAMEAHVVRSLDLLGSWRHGQVKPELDLRKAAAMAGSNARKVVDAARKFRADAVLLGNLDFIGLPLLQAVLTAGYPVLHAIGNIVPGYAPAEQPNSPQYWAAPASDWTGNHLRQTGYAPAGMATVYPGARIDRYYHLFLPDLGRLRIAFAGLVLPYKGPQVLVEALAALRQQGVDFTAEIAGDTTDPTFVEKLRTFCAQAGMADRVTFPGFLDRGGLAGLFARSNVLVFPSQVPEMFGISQVEAMAAGLVVVSSGTGGASEVIRDGRDGLVFRADDVAGLASRLLQLAAKPDLFRRLQQQGQLRALDFSVDGSVCRVESLLEELLAGRAAVSAA